MIKVLFKTLLIFYKSKNLLYATVNRPSIRNHSTQEHRDFRLFRIRSTKAIDVKKLGQKKSINAKNISNKDRKEIFTILQFAGV